MVASPPFVRSLSFRAGGLVLKRLSNLLREVPKHDAG
jgi:hypothetical protein